MSIKVIAGRPAFLKLGMIVVVSAVITTVALVGSKQRAAASAFGPSPTYTSAPGEGNCTACHSDFKPNSGSGEVKITGIPANYTPGQQYNVTVTTTQADGVIFGFQLTAIDDTGHAIGTFTLPAENPPREQILPGIVSGITRQYVEHTSDGLSNGQFGFNSWTFGWTAPPQAVGTISFFAAGNAANSDGGPSGDYIYIDSKTTTPLVSIPVTISGKVFTAAGLALRNAQVVLTNSGNVQTFAVTSSFGVYSFSGVPSGSEYTLTVQSKRYRFAPKTISLAGDLTNLDFIGLE